MTANDGYDFVEFNFFGGEPMLAFPLIRDTIDWFYSNQWAKESDFLITTNGTILNDEMKDWLFRNRKKVSVAFSIDGTSKAHNINRNNSYDLLRPNIDFFKSNWPNQAAKMTIGADTIPYMAEGIIKLETMGLKFTANLSHEDMWDNRKEKLLEIYEEQLSLLVDYYASNTEIEPVKPILDSFPEYLGLDKKEQMGRGKEFAKYCGAGFHILAVDIDGIEYPCHRFIPWISGNPAPGREKFQETTWKPQECRECKLLYSCPSCVARNWSHNNDFGYRTTFHCEFFKLEVLASAQLQAIKIQGLLDNNSLTVEEANKQKMKLDAIFELIENGV